MEPKYVYLIAGFGYSHEGVFKIGITSNYKQRLAQIRQGVPFDVLLVCVVAVDDPQELEQRLLAKFQSYNIRGEWLVSYRADVDFQTCTYREAAIAVGEKSKKLEREIVDYMLSGQIERVV